MIRRLLVGVLLLAWPGAVVAQAPPESLLSRGCQLYLRFDGLDAHRDAFNNSALGKTVQGDVGTFLTGLVKFLDKQVDAVAGGDPQRVEFVRHAAESCQLLGRKGFRLGIELGSLAPVDIEATLVFPQAARGKGNLPELLTRAVALAGFDVKKVKRPGGDVHFADVLLVRLSWWVQDDTVLVLAGTRGPLGALARIEDKKPNVTSQPLYQKLRQFKEFPAWADGFLDVPAILKIAGDLGPDPRRLIAELGLAGLKSASFHWGIDGPAEHGLVILDMPEPRHGLLRFATRKNIKLADLPAMPPDLTSFHAANVDVPRVYDILLEGIEAGLKIYAPGFVGSFKNGIKLAEGLVGIKLREDLVGALGDMYVQYSSRADGPLGMGTVYLFKVKDDKKLAGALDSLLKTVTTLPFLNARLEKKKYHGADITTLRISSEGFFQLPSYTIHKGWLAVCGYPQPLHGFVLRSNGDLPAWKVNAALKKRLADFPQEFIAVSVSDPRPALQFLLSLGPTLVGLINNFTSRFGPDVQFDAGLLPNAHEATRHLFPNITVTTDDGRTLRIRVRASLILPF